MRRHYATDKSEWHTSYPSSSQLLVLCKLARSRMNLPVWARSDERVPDGLAILFLLTLLVALTGFKGTQVAPAYTALTCYAV